MPLEHDALHFEDQVPGGMMGTLRDQLSELGMQGRLEEFLNPMNNSYCAFQIQREVHLYSGSLSSANARSFS
jgi:hypothetical protein